ncbi:MAG: hypothetical protein EAZ53_10665 [Bacteroidetes bacterium]|nr:MAG: hypothetical protein EAZ53_10665 [Bacteroidota bacterium]
MNKKELLNAEIQLLAIFVSLILGIGAGIGFVFTVSGLETNFLLILCVSILILCFIIIGFIAISSYIRIVKIINQFRP